MSLADYDPEYTETDYLYDFAELDGKQVLEVGCGDGRITWLYAAFTQHTTAVDSDADELAVARADFPDGLRGRISFMQAAAEQLPFARERFDRAIFAWSL